MSTVHVIGGGLAGSEAAWQLAESGVGVVLHEMRPVRMTPAHKTDRLAELVCSNSFRSDDADSNAVGVLHAELRGLGSLIMRAADNHPVPAGSALAVDREAFAAEISARIEAHPRITVSRAEVTALPEPHEASAIVATGPLTSAALAASIAEATGAEALAFFDAIAPIVHADSIDLDVAWFQSRYDKPGPNGTGADYLNCPMTKAEYDAFVDALLAAETVAFHAWEDTPYFDGCLPIEVMAARGRETLRHGPMKPMGLTNAHRPHEKPYAVVQLRQDNRLGTLFNIVGFQTKLRYGAQTDVLRMIPGLGEAQFARLGGLHRNTYIDAPRLLDTSLRLRSRPSLRFAGQITGCEGYVESTAIGLLAGRFLAGEALGSAFAPPPETTAIGALLAHVTGGHLAAQAEPGTVVPRSYQPMNINFGLFPPLEAGEARQGRRTRLRGRDRKAAFAARARDSFARWCDPAATGVELSEKNPIWSPIPAPDDGLH